MHVVCTQNKKSLSENFLDEEEAKVLAYLKRERTELEEVYLTNLQEGRRGITQRLFQALIREQLIEEKKVSWLETNQTSVRVKLPSGKIIEAVVQKRHSLGRFDLEKDLVVYDQDHSSEILHPVELLLLLRQEGVLKEAKEEQFQRFKEEVQNGAANLTLALTGAAQRKRTLAAEAKANQINTSLEWVINQKKTNKSFSPLAFYEQWVIEGHPLHPGAKTKFGLETADVIRYSPEWGAAFGVAVIAVSKKHCQMASVDEQNMTTRLYQEYEGLQSAVEESLKEQGVHTDDFELIPLHPWQFKHTLPNLYKEEIEQKKIIPILNFQIPAQSLVSFRSLSPVQHQGEAKHHIKTAVNIQTTSAVRTVSPNSVENGPILSNMLVDIQEREKGFEGSFIVLEERAGIYFQPDNEALAEEERWTLQANLGSILRENPENHVKDEKEIPMAAASLLAKSPVSGKLIAVELLEELASHHGITNAKEAASLFVRKYAEASLPGFLTLMVKYGIGLEGHMQNSVCIFRHGELVRILLRDFGGARILPERLNKQGFEAVFYPGSSIVTDKVKHLRNIISYSVMQNHFAELITSLVRELDCGEEELWQQVSAVCQTVFTKLKKDAEIAEQAEADEEALFQPMIDLKALTTMRLRGDITEYSFRKVPNPMMKWKGEKKR